MKAAGSHRIIRFGDFEADLHVGELRKHGVRIRLQEQPFRILTMLVEQAGDVVSREMFRQVLWPADTFVDFDHGLSAAVNKLREALCDSADHPRYVETIPRRGYRFIAQVNRFGAPPAIGEPQAQPAVPRRTKGVVRPARLVGLGLAGVAVVLVGLNAGSWRERLTLRPGDARVRSIAVLPLENLSGDPSQQYFADGMTEELITQLGKVSALRVISHTSVNRFKGTKRPVQEIARELQVEAIVEGTVSREANRVRVTANLIQAFPEKHLWAESYDRDLPNVLDLQSEVARTIADQIKITVTPEEKLRLSRAQTVNPEAHELYLKGTFYNNKWSNEGFERGIEYFNKALQKEPRNAQAYAGLAVAYGGLGISGDIAAYPKQKATALKAIEIDDTLAEAHTALAWAKFTYDWDTAGAEREFHRAIELNPSDARAHAWYGVYLAMLGRNKDSLQQVKSARELDPLSLANTSLAWATFYHAREYDKAIEVCQSALEMDPNFFPAHWRLIAIYEQQGDLEKAIEMREREAIISEHNSRQLVREAKSLRKAYAANGARGYWLQKLKLIKADVNGRDSIDIGTIYSRLGNKDEAFRWLQIAFRQHLPYLIWDLHTDPALDGLRSDPRYAELLRRLVPRPV